MNLARVLIPRLVCLIIAAMLLAVSLPDRARAGEDNQQRKERSYRIGFHFWKPGKIYDEAMSGIRDGLEIADIRYEPVVVYSNQDEELAVKNLKMLDSLGLDVIYSLSSAGTQVAKKIGMNTPVIATVINHPASLNISEAQVGNNVKLSGTSYYIDVKEQLKLYRELFPGARKIGMIYDSKNPAGYLAEEPFLRKACATAGLDFASVGVDSANDLPQATQHLLEAGTNMIVIPTNNLIYDNLSPVVEVTNRNQVPVVSMSKQGVENGALAALYADIYDLGRQAAELAARILREDLDPREAGFQYARHPDIIINLTSAKALQYQFPPNVLGKAAIVIR
jgi:putative tryptophan/tyrosine transport system substrate-binding protein